MKASALTIGLFDGVHLGHQYIIRRVVEVSTRDHLRSIAVTFDRHPSEILSKENNPKLITQTEVKTTLIKEMGIEQIELIEFNREFAELDPQKFLEVFLLPLNVSELIVGEDFMFGHNRKGDMAFLDKYASINNIKLVSIALQRINGEKISSSRIRQLIVQGNIELAAKYLGRYPLYTGQVVRGESRASSFGYPTANIELHNNLCLPKSGVYAGEVTASNFTRPCLINIGYAPTYGDRDEKVFEVHILDYKNELYGQKLNVTIKKMIREEKRFADEKSLVNQISKDVKLLRNMIR